MLLIRGRLWLGTMVVEGPYSAVATFCVVSAVLTAAVCCFARLFGERTQLIAHPDGDRRLHDLDTPLIGGLAVLVPTFVVALVYMIFHKHEFYIQVAIIASVFMLIVGVLDDRLGVSPLWRMLALVFVSFVVFSLEPIFVLHSLHLWILHINWVVPLDPVAAPITALMIVGFVNAANMADGMNGQLLGSLVIWSAFIIAHLGFDAAVPFVMLICSTAVALVFNLRGKLFSGSAGAYAASLFVALGAIVAYRRSGAMLYAQTPAFWFWLPVLDCLRLFIFRMMQGRSPFAGDRNHFHHMLLDFLRARYALAIYLALLCLPGLLAEFGEHWGKIGLVACTAVYAVIVAWRVIRRNQASVRSGAEHSLQLFGSIDPTARTTTLVGPAE